MTMEGRSLEETPTWAVATVITLLVNTGFLLHAGLKRFGKWLDRTKRKHLLAALDKIEEGNFTRVDGIWPDVIADDWITFVAKICVKSSALSSRFYPCVPHREVKHSTFPDHDVLLRSNHLNSSMSRLLLEYEDQHICPKDHQSFASYDSLEQLHRFLFVLGITHVSYSFLAIALAMIKIYSWRTWENHAKTLAFRGLLSAGSSNDSQDGASNTMPIRHLLTFIFHHTSHPWSQHRVLVWLLCFSRQFWSSINQADYMALRLGFLTTHQLRLTYDFHNYMLRSMEEEFRDIVGISIPLWVFAISCILLGFHGTNIYFWASFIPTVLILVVGTKLHHIVVKLAVEITDSSQWTGFHQFKLRDELFWFGNPRFLLRLIQFVFPVLQNAFEMAMYIWSLWEIRGPSCFAGNSTFLVIRLTFGVIAQFWCSFITFPLYVIVTQMWSKFKKTIVSENVIRSLHGWRRKVKSRQDGPGSNLLTVKSTTSLDSLVENEEERSLERISTSVEGCSTTFEWPDHNVSVEQSQHDEIYPCEEKLQDLVETIPRDDKSC